jgi:acyl-coenzyme A thioesterase PaaI-like protein
VRTPEEYRAAAQHIYDDVPFLRWLGLEVLEASPDRVLASIGSREDLIGNPHPHILHGGVICAVMDSVGGVLGILKYLDEVEAQGDDAAFQEAKERTKRLATIDLRADFLSPGRGNTFLCEGKILRLGGHVIVSRTEFRNEQDVLIAVGTSSYNY